MILVDVRVLQYPEAARYVSKLAGLNTVVFAAPCDVELSDAVVEFIYDRGPLVSTSKLSDPEFWLTVFREYPNFSVFVLADDDEALASACLADNEPAVKLVFDGKSITCL